MGLFDFLRRKPRLMPVEGISSLPSAIPGLTAAGISFSGAAGVCLKAMHGRPSKLDLTGLLAGAELPARYELASDEYNCIWAILRGDLNSVVDATERTAGLLNEAGYGGNILCIAFEFRSGDRKAYWIYDRDGRFYPFAAQNNEHDVRFELHMKDAASGTIPVENAVNKWYPLWGMPF